MKENTKETDIAYLTTKFILLLQKNRARKTSLEATTNVRLANMIYNADEEQEYTLSQLHFMTKAQLVKMVLDMEGTQQALKDYATQLKERNVNVQYIEQIESFGV